MSIPKEPRQLMINLMYLVLTALLALNVSAQIFNAFKLVDDGLQKSNSTLEATSSRIPDRIAELAQKNPEKYQIYADKAVDARQVSKEFIDYVEEIKRYLIDSSGGVDPETGKLKGYKNKDITTRYLVGRDPATNDGKGAELENRIKQAAQEFLSLVDSSDQGNFAGNITLDVSEDWKEDKNAKNWAHFNFFQMPVLAVLPILSKIENDARSTEAALLNYFLDKAGGESIEFDKYEIVSSARRSYVIAGEPYEAEVFLSAATSNPDGVQIFINGSRANLEEGVAKFRANTSSTGVQKYSVSAKVINPVTDEVTEVPAKTFEYEVGRRSATVSLDKMNVFYIGVENPISVSAAGVSSNDLNVTGTGAGIKLRNTAPGKYIVTVTQPGEATVTLSGGGLSSTQFKYRVKRIPDPYAKVARSKGGSIASGEMRVQPGMIADLEGFDFEARCTIESFRVIRTRRGDDPAVAVNNGAAFTGQAKSIISGVQAGDQVLFTDIKGKCPGDAVSRGLNTLVFTVR